MTLTRFPVCACRSGTAGMPIAATSWAVPSKFLQTAWSISADWPLFHRFLNQRRADAAENSDDPQVGADPIFRSPIAVIMEVVSRLPMGERGTTEQMLALAIDSQ